MTKIRWGILSTANIGLQKVIPAIQKGQYCEVIAIASRNADKARKAAEMLGIAAHYGSYQELLDDPNVDAVYNPMPNHLHVPWSIQALQSGKHVLCEKPLACSHAEAKQLLAVAKTHPKLKIMEAFMYRHHPQWQKAKDIVTSDGIGTLRTVHSFFSYFNSDPGNVRNIASIGGGGLMDIGCYNISLSRFIFDSEPERVLGLIEVDPEFQTDRLTSGILEFSNGTATFTCATQLAPYQSVNIYGTEGRIEIDIPFNAPPDKPCLLWHQSGGDLNELVFPICDQYTLQGDLFAQAILQNSPVPTPLEDGVINMKVIEAIVQSAKQNSWIALN